MKLFIDTSNKKLILAKIDYANNVVDFMMKDTNNDMVKNSVNELEQFINKDEDNKFTEFLFTIGPGSFTGVKVAYNIVRSYSLVQDIEKIYIIDSFKLIERNDILNTIIPFGKSKYYHKRLNKSKVNIITKEELNDLDSINNGYDNFDKELLEQKIKSKSFKIVDNLDKVKIKYLSNF